jgi:hypothetical protein
LYAAKLKEERKEMKRSNVRAINDSCLWFVKILISHHVLE